MTECERLIANGTFTRDFFKPEVRCDFLVDEKRKKIWAIEMDLVRQVEMVCKRHKLRYFLMAGSILGAVRHHGMIPWDDDIDVALPRDDYERLLTLTGEFEEPYFFQYIKTDPQFYYMHARLRNSRTTAIDRPFSFQDFNHGVFLDILPLDYICGDEEGCRMYERCAQLCYDNSTCMKRSNPMLSPSDMFRVSEYSGKSAEENYQELQMIAGMSHAKRSGNVTFFAGTAYGLQRNFFLAADYDDTVDSQFENLSFQIPIGYENILKTTYGDYMQFPPIEQRGAWHSNIYFNPDVGYADIINDYRDAIRSGKEFKR